MPAGLRGALSVKDDDYRLSFLHGNFMTLTNLDEDDLERIEELRLSPLYVSLHAWDDDARVRLMGRAAAGSRAVSSGSPRPASSCTCRSCSARAGTTATCSPRRCGAPARWTAVADLGVVPVSLAAEGDLRRVTADDAARRDRGRRRPGSASFRAAARRGLRARRRRVLPARRREPPASDAPEQYENGVGIAAALLRARLAAAGRATAAGARAGAASPASGSCCGTLAAPGAGAGGRGPGRRRRRPRAALRRRERASSGRTSRSPACSAAPRCWTRCAATRSPTASGCSRPRVWLPEELGRTLDDVGEDELAAACGGRLVVADSLGDAFARLSR